MKLKDMLKQGKEKLEMGGDMMESPLLSMSVADIARTFARNRIVMLDYEAKEDFLGVKPEDQRTLMEGYPHFMNAMVSQAVMAYLKNHGLNIVSEVNFKWSEKEIPVIYSDMIVKRGEKKLLIFQGMLMVQTDNGVKAVVLVDFGRMGGGVVEIAYAKRHSEFFADAIKEINALANEFDYMRGEKISADGRLLEIGEYGWDDIVLEDGIRESIENNIINFLAKRDLYHKNGIPFKRGVILEGPPGTGKTLLSKVISNKVDNVTFILATAKDMGYSEDVANCFGLARRLAPSVIFMEDIDFFGPSRTGTGKVMKITGELLNQMDGIEDNNGILVVATTNHPELIDEALMRRPGRFDVRLEVGALSIGKCEILLKKFLDGRQMTEDIDIAQVASQCEGFTGSHVRDLANDVCIRAINEGSVDENGFIILQKEHFEKAIDRIKTHMGLPEPDENVDDDAPVREDAGAASVEYTKGFDGFFLKKEVFEDRKLL